MERVDSLSERFQRWQRGAAALSDWASWLAGAGLTAMLVLSVADIVCVQLFSRPIPGAIEIIGFLGVVVAGFAISHTYLEGQHVRVSFFVSRLPERLQTVVTGFVSLLGTILFLALAWQSVVYGRALQQAGELSMTQRLPFYPFVFAIALGCLPMVLVLLIEFLQAAMKVFRK